LFAITADKPKIKKIESKVVKKAVNETAKSEAGVGITGAVIAEGGKATFSRGVVVVVVIVIIGLLLYILGFGTSKQREKVKKFVKRDKDSSKEEK